MPSKADKKSKKLSTRDLTSHGFALPEPPPAPPPSAESLVNAPADSSPRTERQDGDEQTLPVPEPAPEQEKDNVAHTSTPATDIPLHNQRRYEAQRGQTYLSPTGNSASPPFHIQTIPRFTSPQSQRWPASIEPAQTARELSIPSYSLAGSPQGYQYGYPTSTKAYWSNNTTPESSPPNRYTVQRSQVSMSPPEHWSRSPPRQFASMAWPGTSPPSNLMRSTVSHASPSPQQHGLPISAYGWNTHPKDAAATHGTQATSFSFDSFQTAGVRRSHALGNVVLVGSNGRVDVHGILQKRTHPIGRLEGLRGAVLQAKIVSWTPRKDPLAHLRPLIALLVHGPCLDRLNDPEQSRAGNGQGTGQSPYLLPHGQYTGSLPWQTTVELFSLKSSIHVTTLYKSALTRATYHPHIRPAPADDLHINAEGKFITIASGLSGEVFIFTARPEKVANLEDAFQCVGKIWTSISKYSKDSRPSTAIGSDSGGPGSHPDSIDSTSGIPLFSLSSRWLAYAPPPSSSSAHAIQGLVGNGNVDFATPGLTSITPPAVPIPNASLNVAAGEGIFSQLARGVTQELIKGANWVGTQGMQAWRNYWNPQGAANPQNEATPSAVPWDRTIDSRFPPTHGDPTLLASRSEVSLVSLLDLDSLLGLSRSANKSPKDPVPFATVSMPSGCSFISLSPSGLLLFTANRDGDMQAIWNLMLCRPGRADPVRGSSSSDPSHIEFRQVAKFSRLTNATIIDVVWSAPRGQSIAILTNKGTVHVFETPSSAVQWPPPKAFAARTPDATGQRHRTSSASSGVDLGSPPTYTSTQLPLRRPSSVTSTVQSISSRAQPIVSAVRNRTTSSSSDTATGTWTATNQQGTNSGITAALSNFNISSAAAGGAKGGKAVVSGVTKSLSAAAGTVNQLRSPEENRFKLSLGTHEATHGAAVEVVNANMIRFLTGHERGYFGSVAGGTVRLNPLKGVDTHQSVSPSFLSPRSQSKEVQITLPRISTPIFHSPHLAAVNEEEMVNDGQQQQQQLVTGFWSPHANYSTASEDEMMPRSSLHPLSYAEIETCAPFQPLYADRRVTLSTFVDAGIGGTETRLQHTVTKLEDVTPAEQRIAAGSGIAKGSDSSGSNGGRWVFGEAIAVTKLDVGLVESALASSLYRTEDYFARGDDGVGSGGIETVRVKRQSEPKTTAAEAGLEPGEGDERSGAGAGASSGVGADFFEQDCALLELDEEEEDDRHG